MIASAELQTAIFTRLNGQITGTVHDNVLPTQAKPYTVIGETTERPWSTLDSEGSEETVTIHTWSSTKGSTQVKQVMAQIDGRLHNAHGAITLASGALVMLRREFMAVLKDDVDGEMLRHGVMRYRAFISE